MVLAVLVALVSVVVLEGTSGGVIGGVSGGVSSGFMGGVSGATWLAKVL